MNRGLDSLRERQFGRVICRIMDGMDGCEIRAAPGCPVGHGLERQRLDGPDQMQQTLSAHIGKRGLFSPGIVEAMRWALPIVDPSIRPARPGGRW